MYETHKRHVQILIKKEMTRRENNIVREIKADTGNRKMWKHIKKLSCLLYTSPSPRDKRQSRMPSSA